MIKKELRKYNKYHIIKTLKHLLTTYQKYI